MSSQSLLFRQLITYRVRLVTCHPGNHENEGGTVYPELYHTLTYNRDGKGHLCEHIDWTLNNVGECCVINPLLIYCQSSTQKEWNSFLKLGTVWPNPNRKKCTFGGDYFQQICHHLGASVWS